MINNTCCLCISAFSRPRVIGQSSDTRHPKRMGKIFYLKHM